MKNIVLLGGSNSVMANGLQKGLREYANVTNFVKRFLKSNNFLLKIKLL